MCALPVKIIADDDDDDVVCRLPCSMVTAALLGAYTVQSELGDYDVHEFGHGVDYLREFQFWPEQTEEVLNKVHEIHKTIA